MCWRRYWLLLVPVSHVLLDHYEQTHYSVELDSVIASGVLKNNSWDGLINVSYLSSAI